MRLLLIALLVLAFVAVGCGQKAEEEPTPDPATPVVDDAKGGKPDTPPGKDKPKDAGQPEDKGQPDDKGKPDAPEGSDGG